VGTAWLVGRAWGLDRALAVAILEAVAARYWWHTSVQLPTVERAIPMSAVLPPLLAISLTGVLVERWPQPMATTARSAIVLRAARYAVLLAVAAAAAAAAAGRTQDTEVWATTLGVAFAGLAAPTLRHWTWMPLVLAGYAWMQHAGRHPYDQAVPHGAAVAAIVLILGGAAYALDVRATGDGGFRRRG
jgi:hypothetical protein